MTTLLCFNCGAIYQLNAELSIEAYDQLTAMGLLCCAEEECGYPLEHADALKPVQPVSIAYLQARYGERWEATMKPYGLQYEFQTVPPVSFKARESDGEGESKAETE